ncbi:MarR family winged helix-turn-helix transcriptional regulator [Aeromonas veronii]|uniref:MarR family winged helix-turn-helix transcriptional regulator n=1 Tax=Aeromonas veronii TaxID=654 RepID=UPI003BA38122
MSSFSNLQKLFNVLAVIREIQTDFPASALQCLTVVMQNEGITQVEVAARTNMPNSTCSRNMRVLSSRIGPNKTGMGLIEFLPDPNDYRFKTAWLTPKGVELRNKLQGLIDK